MKVTALWCSAGIIHREHLRVDFDAKVVVASSRSGIDVVPLPEEGGFWLEIETVTIGLRHRITLMQKILMMLMLERNHLPEAYRIYFDTKSGTAIIYD